MIKPRPPPLLFFTNGTEIVTKLVSDPSTWLWSTMVDGILSILYKYSFTLITGIPRPRTPQKGKHFSQYDPSLSFYRTLYGTFVFNNNFWATPYFLLDFNFFLTNTMSPVSNYLTRLPFLHIYLCLSLL